MQRLALRDRMQAVLCHKCPGCMQELLEDNVKVKEMIATARAVLGYDILEAWAT